jgi:hypothetical protein
MYLHPSISFERMVNIPVSIIFGLCPNGTTGWSRVCECFKSIFARSTFPTFRNLTSTTCLPSRRTWTLTDYRTMTYLTRLAIPHAINRIRTPIKITFSRRIQLSHPGIPASHGSIQFQLSRSSIRFKPEHSGRIPSTQLGKGVQKWPKIPQDDLGEDGQCVWREA